MQSSEQHFIIVITFRLIIPTRLKLGLNLMETATKTKTKIQEF